MNHQPRTNAGLPLPPSPSASPRRELTLFDSICIIVGIIIGSGIYRTSPDIAGLAPNLAWLMGLWLLGGALSLIGAACYAELATAYPKEGGDYVYLTRAFGRSVGFLFAWCQLWIVRPGSIGVMAFAFAEYANQIFPRMKGRPEESYVLTAYAAASIVALTAVNLLGVREGKWTQNILTLAKVLGLAAIVAVGFTHSEASAGDGPNFHVIENGTVPFTLDQFGFAMVLVLFTYGGWNEMAFVSAEVKEPRKNILRAMLLGTLAVTAIYVLVILAFVHALGLQGSRNPTVAADVLGLGIGPWAGQAISALICISALGAINGQIFTGSRIYYAMGSDHRLYSWLGRWDVRRGVPVPSLLIQGAITLALAVWFGLSGNGFQKMVIFTTPGFWVFLALVGVSVFVLRWKDANVDRLDHHGWGGSLTATPTEIFAATPTEISTLVPTKRPFRVPGYPVTPIVFCLSCGFMVYSTLVYAVANSSWEAIWSIGILLAGVAVVGVQKMFKS
jgi:basic amino acid/polyamine antiporter, APA family